jgi:PHS family inorganic phosphate transporter-like MFS transporter
MAGVFLMQPLGRLTASAMSLLILETLGKSRGIALETNQETARATLDSMWRFVIGMGSLLAFIALILRFTISESPRFTFNIKNNRLPPEQLVQPPLHSGIKKYFSTQGNWQYLAGTSGCALLFETVYSGLGVNNPQVLARIWSPLPFTNSTSHLLDWGDPLQSDTSIYQTFMQDSIHSIIAVSTGSLVGSIILIMSIDYISRRKLLFWCFLGLACLFVIIGGCLFNTSYKSPGLEHRALYSHTDTVQSW